MTKPSLNEALRSAVVVFTSAGTLAGGCGPITGPAASALPGSQGWCLALAEETISLAEELMDTAEQGGVDQELACQFLTNELQLLDEGCIDESDLGEGTTRESLLAQLEQYDCPQAGSDNGPDL